MRKYLVLPLMAGLFLGCSSSDNELTCEHNSRTIKCTVKVDPSDEVRKVDFYWKSPNSPTDDRSRTIKLAANNQSLFDGRYTRGRAKGEWEVTAIIDGDEASTTFTIE